MWLIQTPGQLRFCWQVIVEWIRSAQEAEPSEETEVVKNGTKSTSPTSEKSTESNGEKEEGVAVLSPGKRTSTGTNYSAYL